ncbi:1402_t:CDS:2 [Racocetra fulgida]|uniref:1402_t:CDS:1 n=1 Tax=Racocetra fulgida TaxID=60492 RepID=A0A9N9EPP7_9GLOM|nr:1402_t:CDS:2 [Racocetra fulgida]
MPEHSKEVKQLKRNVGPKEFLQNCKAFRDSIQEILVSIGFHVDSSKPQGLIYSGRDKDYKIIVRVKHRTKKNLGFDDPERLKSMIDTYYSGHEGFIVTDCRFSSNCEKVAKTMMINLCKEGMFKELVLNRFNARN